jgi:hypothetical protein
VTTTTSGEDFDLSAYLVSIGEDVRLIESNDVTTFADLVAGDHTVSLTDVADNCSVDGGASRQATVTGGNTAEVEFDVSCAALPPAEVDVTGTWEGVFRRTDAESGGTLMYELEQDGDQVTGTEIVDEGTAAAARYGVEGRVSGNTVALFVLGWTDPLTGYRHRRTSTGEVTGDVLSGRTEEQREEVSSTFTVTRQ